MDFVGDVTRLNHGVSGADRLRVFRRIGFAKQQRTFMVCE